MTKFDQIVEKIVERFETEFGMCFQPNGDNLVRAKQFIRKSLTNSISEVLKDLNTDLEDWKDDNLTEGESDEFGRGMDGAIEYIKGEIDIIERDSKRKQELGGGNNNGRTK